MDASEEYADIEKIYATVSRSAIMGSMGRVEVDRMKHDLTKLSDKLETRYEVVKSGGNPLRSDESKILNTIIAMEIVGCLAGKTSFPEQEAPAPDTQALAAARDKAEAASEPEPEPEPLSGTAEVPFKVLGKAKILFLHKNEKHRMTSMELAAPDLFVFIEGINLYFATKNDDDVTGTSGDYTRAGLAVPLMNIHGVKEKGKGASGTDGQITIYFEPEILRKNKVIIQPIAEDTSYTAKFFSGDSGKTRNAMAAAIKSAVESVTGMDFDARTEDLIKEQNQHPSTGGGKKSRRKSKRHKRRKSIKRKSKRRKSTKRRKSKTRRRRR